MTALVTAGCAISPQQEAELGRNYAAQLENELPIVDDPAVDNYLDALGNEVARQAGRRNVQYQFYLVNSDVANAFAVPGGYIYINRGIVERAPTMNELAGVLAHEIAHVELRHGAEQMGRAQTANTGLTLAYILLGRTPGTLERTALGVGGSLYFANHSRDAENEADARAVPMLVNAGIDPRGLASFFRTLLSEQDRGSGNVGQWFSTHPTTQDRVDHVENLVGRYSRDELSGLQRDSQAYQRFRAAVRNLPAAPG